MKIFITGATGYIGQKLALKLAGDGHQVIALVRDKKKADKYLKHPAISCIKGDLFEKKQLLMMMQGCDEVYHLAALASVWHKDRGAFYLNNVTAFKNVLDCCLELNVKNVVFTSTAGVAGHSSDGNFVREYTNEAPDLETDYEKSKVAAEHVLLTYCSKGIRGVIVNPSRVYGPGLLTESNGVTRLIKMYLNGKWHIIPGDGKSIGNYVFIDDVVNGHLLAMEKGKAGERYLLGGENYSFMEFFSLLIKLTGKKHRLFKFPLPMMMLTSRIALLLAKTFGWQPIITPPFVRKYNKNWILGCDKAELELGYIITPLREGMKKTIEWITHSDATAVASSS